MIIVQSDSRIYGVQEKIVRNVIAWIFSAPIHECEELTKINLINSS